MNEICKEQHKWSWISKQPAIIASSINSNWTGFEFQEIETSIEGAFNVENSAIRFSRVLGPMKVRFVGRNKSYQTVGLDTRLTLPGEVHTGFWEGKQRGIHLYIDKTAIEQLVHQEFRNEFMSKTLVSVDCLNSLMAALHIDVLNGSPSGPALGENIIMALVNQYLTSIPLIYGNHTTNLMSERELNRIKEWIDLNINTKISLDSLAQQANVSVRLLCRVFNDKFGCSPYKFIITRRVEKARELIEEGRLNLADIAEISGFSSQSHMTITFQRVLGRTPSAFKP